MVDSKVPTSAWASPPCPARKPKQCASLGLCPLWHRSRDPAFDKHWIGRNWLETRNDSMTWFWHPNGFELYLQGFWFLLFVLHVLHSEICKWSIHWTFVCQQRRHTLNIFISKLVAPHLQFSNVVLNRLKWLKMVSQKFQEGGKSGKFYVQICFVENL